MNVNLPSILDLPISDPFGAINETHIESQEGELVHTVIILNSATDSECEDLFEESDYIDDCTNLCYEDITNSVGLSPIDITQSVNTLAENVLDLTEEENGEDADCVLISDDEDDVNEIATESNQTQQETCKPQQIAEATEETIMNEFYFEDEDICIVDEHKLEGPKKTLVRHTGQGYHCPMFCTFKTKQLPLMVAHLIKHKKSVMANVADPETSYKCPMCSFTTFFHGIFVKHIYNHKRNENRYYVACSKCSYVTDNMPSLKKHTASRHAAYLYCHSCHFKTRRKKNLRSHEDRCKKTKKAPVFKCHFEPCPFTAPAIENLKTHEWIQHQVGSDKIRNYKCPLDGCHFETFREDLFDEHVGSHCEEEFQCKLCNYKTVDFVYFKRHILQHITVA